jgi:acyl carrier protein
MTRDEIFSTLISHLDSMGFDTNEADEETSLVDHLSLDSLDKVELVMLVEQSCGVSIPDDEAEKLATLKDVIDYIKDHSEN